MRRSTTPLCPNASHNLTRSPQASKAPQKANRRFHTAKTPAPAASGVPINRPFLDGLFLLPLRLCVRFDTPSPRAYFYEIRRARRAMGSLPLRAYARRFFCRRQRPSPTPSNKTAISPRKNASASRKRRADKPPLPRWAFSVAAPAMRSLRRLCVRFAPAYAFAARLFLRNTARPPRYAFAFAPAMRSLRSPHTPPPRAYFCEIRRARRAMGSLTLRAYARRFFCYRQIPPSIKADS